MACGVGSRLRAHTHTLSLSHTQDSGALVAASISGVSVNEAAKKQVLARKCANMVIKSAAKFLETKPSLHAADGKLYLEMLQNNDGNTDMYWIQSSTVSDPYGLVWHSVVVERVNCPAGK